MNHLSQARLPTCAAIYSRYLEQQRAFPGILESDDEDMATISSEEDEFHGDFYGERYTDQDFPGFEEDLPDYDENMAENESVVEAEEMFVDDMPDPYWSSSDSDSDDEDNGEDGEDLRFI